MGSGAQVVDVPEALLVAQHIAAILQNHTGIGQAFGRQVCLGVARTIDHATDQNGFVAKQIFTHQHTGARCIGAKATAGSGAVFRQASMRCSSHFQHIAQRSQRARRDVEFEAHVAGIGRNQGVGHERTIQASRTFAVAKTRRRTVDNQSACD